MSQGSLIGGTLILLQEGGMAAPGMLAPPANEICAVLDLEPQQLMNKRAPSNMLETRPHNFATTLFDYLAMLSQP